MSALLETVGLTRFFGMVRAAEALNIRIDEGEMVGIIGSNGSSKTTFLNLVTGYLKPDSGRILLDRRDTTALPPRRIARLGVARSFQVPQLYIGLTVMENLLLSFAARSGRIGFWRGLQKPEWVGEARQILAQFALGSYADRPVAALPEGARKLLDIALAAALRPRLLLMDEPTAGVSTEDKFAAMDTTCVWCAPTAPRCRAACSSAVTAPACRTEAISTAVIGLSGSSSNGLAGPKPTASCR
jgi:branched-chain amino acid transport system ATP-binding protein